MMTAIAFVIVNLSPVEEQLNNVTTAVSLNSNDTWCSIEPMSKAYEIRKKKVNLTKSFYCKI
uniref:Uncharacterized protein n=1 Tax=Glossina pallidipes TaxID=7398 RepID=A0A1A9ZYL9_GLOPL